MPLTILNGPIIAAGESLSAALDCTSGDLVRITMPADWTYSGGITFQISSDGQFFNDLYNRDGSEIKVAVVPGAALVVPVDIMRAVAFVKFRSGTVNNPVPQPVQRQFAVAVSSSAVP